MTHTPPKLSKSIRLLYIFAWISIFLTFFIFGRLLFNLAYPYRLSDVVTPLPLANGHEYHRGDEVTFIVDYVKYNNFPTHSTRRIECDDGDLVTLSQVTVNLPLGHHVATSLPTKIPEKTSTGWCRIVLDVHYQINAFRTEMRIYETEAFYVLPNSVEEL